mmetsp:Transcript_51952/g.121816  ORF Transcript_51952/g.121816 Transcript_51952/m.121816 type:complete len:850 (-) Transcript_51952:328-2877(-)
MSSDVTLSRQEHSLAALFEGIYQGVRQVAECAQKLQELLPHEADSPLSPSRISLPQLPVRRKGSHESTGGRSASIRKQVSFKGDPQAEKSPDVEVDSDVHLIFEGSRGGSVPGTPGSTHLPTRLPIDARSPSRRSSVFSDSLVISKSMAPGTASKTWSFIPKDAWAYEDDSGDEEDEFQNFLEDCAEKYAKKPDHTPRGNGSGEGNPDSTDAQAERTPCWRRSRMLHPQSRKRLFWDALSVAMIGFDVIMLPMIYGMSISETVEVLAVEWVCTIFWSIDMFMTFVTGYTVGPEVVMAPRKVAYNYLTTWFAVDFAIVGSEWASRITEFIQGFNAFRAARAVRVLRVVRVVRLIRLARMVKTLHKLMEMTGSLRLLIIFNVLKMATLLLLAVHFFSVGWHFVGFNTAGGWVDKEGFLEEPAMVRYVAAVRWTLAQLNGRTDRQERTFVEMLYIGFTACFTLIFMSIFVSSLTSRMLQLQQLMDRESGYKRLLQRYREMHSLSFPLLYLAKRHIKDRSTLDSDLDTEAQLLRLLPVQTQADLLMEVRMPLLSNHPLFRVLKGEYNATLRTMLTQAVKQESSRYMETVFAKGSVCHQMYFVDGPRLLYSRDTGLKSWLADRGVDFEKKTKKSPARRVQNMLGRKSQFLESQNEMLQNYELPKGSYLCEACIWADKWVNQGDFISTSHSKLVTIRSDAFAEAVSKHEDSKHFVSYYARHFVEELRKSFDTGESNGDIFNIDLYHVLGVASPELLRQVSKDSLNRMSWPRTSFASVLRAGAPAFLRGGTSSSSQLSSNNTGTESHRSGTPQGEKVGRGVLPFQESFYKLNTIPSMHEKEVEEEAHDVDACKLSL